MEGRIVKFSVALKLARPLGVFDTFHCVLVNGVSTAEMPVVLFLSRMFPVQFGAALNVIKRGWALGGGDPPIDESVPPNHGAVKSRRMVGPPGNEKSVLGGVPSYRPVFPSKSLKLTGSAAFPASAITHA